MQMFFRYHTGKCQAIGLRPSRSSFKSSLGTQTEKVELPSLENLQPSNAQWHDHSGTTYLKKSSTSVSTRVRQRKQARNKEQVKCCRENQPCTNEYSFMFFFSLFLCRSVFVYSTVRKADRQQLIWSFPSTADTQPCDGPPSRHYHCLCGYRCD